jgi:hypothetical protein
MKRVIILSAIIVAMFAIAGNVNGQTKETRNVKGFSKISFGVAGNLYVKIGPEFNVVIEGEKKYIDDVITDVSGGKLVIKKDNWKFGMNEKVNVYITMPSIESLGVSGSGKAEIQDAVKSEELNLSVSGSGKLNVSEISTSMLSCSISGSGDIYINKSGTADKAEISVSGSGNYVSEALKIGTAEIHISGSGNCTCNVSESLRASVSGSGDVSYRGNPKIDAHVSGSGKIRSL